MAAAPPLLMDQESPVPLSFRLSRPLAAAVLGAVLLAPLQPPLSASAAPTATPAETHATQARTATRATQTTLTAYGDADSSGTIHLTGSVRWSNGEVLGHKQHVELWGKTAGRWSIVRNAVTDRRGDVEIGVTPTAHTKYQLRYAGSHSATLSKVAAPSLSAGVTVHAVAHVTLNAPATVRRGQTFVVTGRVTPAGPRRVVTLAGDGRTFTTLTTRADGSFSGRVRLRQRTTLSVVLPDTATLDGAVSGPRVVRVGRS